MLEIVSMKKSALTTLLLICLGAFSGCGGGGEASHVSTSTTPHQEAEKAALYSAQIQAQAERSAEPTLQERPPSMPRQTHAAGNLKAVSGQGADHLLGDPDTSIHKNGRVADVIVKWLKIKNSGSRHESDSPVSYVVYSFLSKNVIDTGSIDDKNGGAVQTELWRHVGASSGRWCRLLTLPNISATSILQLEESLNAVQAPVGGIGVTFLMGTSDGAIGKVRFWDMHPETMRCAASDIKAPADETSGKIYTQFIPAPVQMLGSVAESGSVDQMKLISINEGTAPDSNKKYANYQYLYTWGKPSACATKGQIAGDEQECRPTSFRPLRARLLKNNRVDDSVEKTIGRSQPGLSEYGLILRDYPVTAFDAKIDSNKGGFSFTYLIGTKVNDKYANGFTYWRNVQGITPLTSPLYRDMLKGSVTPQGLINYIGRRINPPSQVLLNSNDTLEYYTVSFGTGQYGRESIAKCHLHGSCAAVTYPADPRLHLYPFPDEGWQSGLGRVKSFADQSLLDHWSFHPKNWNSFFITGSLERRELGFMDEHQPDAVRDIRWVLTAHDLWPSFATLYEHKSRFDRGDYPLIYVGQYDAFVAPNPANDKGLKVYRVARLDDIDYELVDWKIEGLTKGGVVLCTTAVVKDVHAAEGHPNTPACAHPRDASHKDGYFYSLAKDIFPHQTYKSSPLFTRYSVSPSGSVLLTYVSMSGGIAQIDASEPSHHWQSRNAWTVISQGRNASCSAVLSKPNPPMLEAQSFLKESMSWGAKKLLSVGIKTALKTALPGPVTDLGVDIGMAFYNADERAKAKKETHDQWIKVYDQVKLTAACS